MKIWFWDKMYDFFMWLEFKAKPCSRFDGWCIHKVTQCCDELEKLGVEFPDLSLDDID